MTVAVTLASTSAARRAVLTAAGVEFEIEAPSVDEDAAKAALAGEGLSPRDMADALAELKALKVSRRRAGLVIGADQTLDLDGELVDKAPTLLAARERLLSLRGRRHKLHSAVVVALDGVPIWRELATSTLTVRDFSNAFLDQYMAAEAEELLHVVGGYRLEGLGAQLFERIDGDYFAILGLPLLGLLDLLRRHGALTS